MFNASATLNVGRLLYNPGLCIPHLTLKSFNCLAVPLQIPGVDFQKIRGVVLDKDNCFAQDHDDKVWPEYQETWRKLTETYAKEHLLIVSNSAGTNDDKEHLQAQILETETGVTVLRHSTKKPGCYNEILDYFHHHGISDPKEIVIIGDRLFTDVLMANMMGSYGIWLYEGVEKSTKTFPSFERMLYSKLVKQLPDDN